MPRKTVAPATTETDALLQSALFTLLDAVAIVRPDGEFRYINHSGSEIFRKHFDMEVQAGDNWLDYVPDERKPFIRNALATATQRQPVYYKVCYQFPGGETWLELGYHPIAIGNAPVEHICVRAKDITEQVHLEQAIQEQQEEAKHRVLKAALEAQDRERQHIGRELHDNVNQMLTTVKLYTEMCLADEGKNTELLQKSLQVLNNSIHELRALSHQLTAPNLDDLDLSEAVRALVESFRDTRRLNISFLTYGQVARHLGADLHQGLYRVAQEHLTNVVKHACSSKVEVILVATSETVALRIQDDGLGFDPAARKAGTGLTSITERVAAIGGEVEWDTAPGRGCTLNVEIPLA